MGDTTATLRKGSFKCRNKENCYKLWAVILELEASTWTHGFQSTFVCIDVDVHVYTCVCRSAYMWLSSSFGYNIPVAISTPSPGSCLLSTPLHWRNHSRTGGGQGYKNLAPFVVRIIRVRSKMMGRCQEDTEDSSKGLPLDSFILLFSVLRYAWHVTYLCLRCTAWRFDTYVLWSDYHNNVREHLHPLT